MKSPKLKIFIIFSFFLIVTTNSFSQCPTVLNNSQSFCDLDSLLISDLDATDNGAGIAWFDTLTSTTPLDLSDSLVDGENYYADNTTGDCGSRQIVTVSILGPPMGLNFQGVCVDQPEDATLADLNLTGNNIQWYLSSIGGSPLNSNTVLTDETTYYADQENPATNCRTSRRAVLVIVGVIPVPEGNSTQRFCLDSNSNLPTVNDLIASGNNNWYLSQSSASPLDLNTTLIDGNSYYATTVDSPCESDSRLEVTVEFIFQDIAGSDGVIEICTNDTNTYNLFDSLNGTPQTGGTWSPALSSGSGIFDPSVDPQGTYTYTISNPFCDDATASVTVTMIPPPDAGTDGVLDICDNDTNTYDLFNNLGGTPQTDGTWSPALSSGSGVFDPSIDPQGTYTYTVISTNPTCEDASASVIVTMIPPPDAGQNGVLDICEDDTNTYNLFDSLGGTPQTGGTWSPALSSGSGIFDPSIDSQGTYTYTVASTNPLCEDVSATVTVTIIPPPDAGTDGVLDICDNDTNTYDLFDNLGGTPQTGGTWSPALSSGSGIFDPSIDSQGTYTYTVISTNPTCEDASASVIVTMIPPPDAGQNGVLDICEDDTNTYNLFDSLGGTPQTGGTWSPALSSGSGIFNPSIDPQGTYTYTVASTNPLCEDVSATVTVTIIPPPDAGTDGVLDICDNDTNTYDLFNNLGGTPQTGGTWSPALSSGSGIFDPSIDSQGTYTYTVISTNPTCEDASASVIVTMIPPPDAGQNGVLDICEDDTNTYNLFDSLGGTPQTGGTWSPALSSGSGIFDPSIDPQGTYTYTVASTNPLCEDVSATVTVTIIPPPDAGTDGVLDICDNDTNTYDLFNNLGGTPQTGGTWSPALSSGSGIFDPSIDSQGTYTYTVISTNPICGNASASVIVTMIPPPDAGQNGVLDICEDDTNTYNLFDSLGGTPQTGGTWSPALSSGSGIFDPSIDSQGTYTYTVASTNPTCEDVSATVTVTIIPTPDAGTDGVLDICDNDTNTYDLFDNLGGTPQTGGTWSPALSSGSGIFDPSIDSQGTYTYTVISTNPICGNASASVIVTMIPPPDAGQNGVLDICEDDTNTYNLFDSLGGTPQTGGTWSPALSSGSGIFDPSIDPQGTYTYTVASTNPICEDVSATVTVTIIPTPDAGTDGVLDICDNDTNTYDLFNNLGGTPQTAGTWSPALSSGSGIFDPSIDSQGTYTYTVISTNPICGNASASVIVTMIPPPDAGQNGVLDICEDDTNTYNLFDSLGGTPQTGGTWSPALSSGSGIFDPSIDSQGTYTYTVASTNPTCEDVSATVTVTIIPTPDAGTDGVLDICDNDTNTYDLFDNLGGTPQTGGTWSPALSSGSGIFDPSIDSQGTYTYTVISTNPICGNASASVIVTMIPPPDAGQNGVLDICEDDTNTYNLFDSLGGTPQTGGTWSPALSSGSGIFDPSIDPQGTYTYTVASTNPICEDVSATVTVTIIPTPDAGTDGVLDICDNDTNTYDLFNNLGGTPQTAGTWSPALSSGSGIFDPSIDSQGTYTYTVISTNPICGNASASVIVTMIPPPDAGQNGVLDICEDDTNTYNLFDSLGGTPQTGGTWSPALSSGSGIFDPSIDSQGTYTYTVASTNPTCEDVSATVTVTIIPTPDAGTDGVLDICDNDTNTYDLFNNLGGTPQTGGTWSPALSSGSGIFDPSIDSQGTYTYTISHPFCGDASATVTVTIFSSPDAGTDGVLGICDNDINIYNLFDSLGGTPQTGGIWSPALSSGTGMFDPSIDPPGTYTYTIVSTNPLCSDASASVAITTIPGPNAGTDGILDICDNDTNTFNLFDNLGGTPQTGGTWSPALSSGSGIFDPNIDLQGTYTYTISNPFCDDATASVIVTMIPPPDAGTDGVLDICNNDTNTYNLFENLNGTPQTGGTWSPALNSASGIFDPSIDSPGIYTYTVASANLVCVDGSATVLVTIIPIPDAGDDSLLNICTNVTNTYNLFDSLNGTPQTGGTWSPALSSGSEIFDPSIDSAGVYTYTVDLTECMQTDTSQVTISFNNPPDLSGLMINVADVCQGENVTVNLNNATNLTDGDYNLSYNITGANTFNQTVAITFINGDSAFQINSDLFINEGSNELSVDSLIDNITNCSGDLSNLTTINFTVFESLDPILINEGNTFCIEDHPTIASLSSNITNTNIISTYWYDSQIGGNTYTPETILENGTTYYASVISIDGCESITRLAVTVSLTTCIEKLIIPDGFSPNGDSINDTFDIKNLNTLYPNFKLTIYNRYGNVLYTGNKNTPKWNGESHSGKVYGDNIVPTGVYFFILEFNDNIRKDLQGRLYLNR
ncbi:gliding motility-associated C-terminal domain-containing protein [Psychroserpens ponticola]|uniref:Gliding motility-associated C-terminal domain-containing protein n=1 Tax=Psychroserpens ponticola TaxID=2932268 RepID=A0ABY7RVQ6_9FLAO|nr:gliding motility-associated C-terminal domain-containing protein [Psychroserpens ponticola]WCO00786.1 gliding motility-associated C-terminal domain-containing protein [Psychroserpens ponticola]